jgi:3'-5' exoribonuclease
MPSATSTQRQGAAGGREASEPAKPIATLREHDELDGIYACARKERQISRAGTPYLNVELGDPTGTILGRVFAEADLQAGRFERGELVQVRGRVERFRERLQANIAAISRAEVGQAKPEDFLPTAYRDLDELEGFLEHLAEEVYEAPLKQLLGALLADGALRSQLRRAPCTVPGQRGAHHAYLGGLLEHTVGVATLAHELCSLHPRLDRDLLLSAAIAHDLGKTREFAYGAEISRSAEGLMLGHVELGLRVLGEHAPAALRPERRLALEHCVLMHHGPGQAGGARFASAEALALYRLNAVDAQVKGAFEEGLAVRGQ